MVSIVIPVYNEADILPELVRRLRAVMDAMTDSCEVVFVDDGGSDGSLNLLQSLAREDERLVVVELQRNFGQHAAIFAGFEYVRGEYVVTLDADLQNPPEEIPKLVAKMEEGYDAVGGWRKQRHDSLLRRLPSRVVNLIMSRATGVALNDYGCMLRAYRRSVVEAMKRCGEISSFIPALANLFAKRVCEVEVGHAERAGGESKYNLFKLIHLNFDLMTGFSLLPIQAVSVAGMLMSLFGLAFGLLLLIARLALGAEWAAQGVFTLFAVLFVFVGLQTLALGIIGEYIGRIYLEVRRRPRFVVRAIHRAGELEGWKDGRMEVDSVPH